MGPVLLILWSWLRTKVSPSIITLLGAALAVLGLQADASPDQVRTAYLRLMRVAHPDRGGSDWLAARLNEARDTLLR